MTSRLIASILLLGVLGSTAWSRPVDLSAPSTELGSAGQKGYLEVWKEVPGLGLQLGSSYLPFRYKFTTDPSVTGGFGPGYYIPMFEARNVMVRERVMRANLPCGKVLYFWQDANDSNKFQTVDKEWTGTVHDEDYTVSRDDGWAINYHQGRLQSVTDDQGHVFKWNYQGEIPTSIDRDGVSVLTVQPNGSGQIGSILQGSKSYEAGYDKRPMTEVVNGIVLIKDLPLALSSFKTPDGKTDSFSFDMSQDRVPGLTVTDSGDQSTSYTWNPTNNYIASEDGPGGKWTYTVGQVTQEFGVPALSRTSSDGKTEGIAIDTKLGTYTRLATNGMTTITKLFETPGPLYQKVKEIQQVSGGVTNTTYRASYDEAGRLIRTINDGYIWTYAVDKNGNSYLQDLSMTKETLAQRAIGEKSLMNQIASAKFESDRNRALSELATYYIQDMQEPEKALALIPQIKDRDSVFEIRVEVPFYTKGMTLDQQCKAIQSLSTEYPEKKEMLSKMFPLFFRSSVLK